MSCDRTWIWNLWRVFYWSWMSTQSRFWTSPLLWLTSHQMQSCADSEQVLRRRQLSFEVRTMRKSWVFEARLNLLEEFQSFKPSSTNIQIQCLEEGGVYSNYSLIFCQYSQSWLVMVITWLLSQILLVSLLFSHLSS